MQFEMNTVAAMLTKAKTPATYEHKGYYGELTIGKVELKVTTDTFKGRDQIVVNSKHYTNYKHGGYKLHEIAKDLVEALPAILEAAATKAESDAKARSLKELQQAHKEDPRISIGEVPNWDYSKTEYTYRVGFKVMDLIEAGIICDMLREFTGYQGQSAKPVAPPVGPRKFVLVMDGDTRGEPFELWQAFGMIENKPDIELFANAVVGEHIFSSEFRYERMS